MIPDMDFSQPDRDVGAMLSGAEVEQLREAVNFVRSNRGLRLKDLARGCDSAEHTVRNFAYGKSLRPDNVFLGRLFKYVASNRELFPDGVGAQDAAQPPRSREGIVGRIARLDLIRVQLPITEGDVQRVFDRYSGYYLAIRRSHRPGRMSVSWLHILPLSPTLDVSVEGLPMPRFTLFIKYADQFDRHKARSHIIAGYVHSRNGRIFLIGHHDGELQSMTLNEPSARPFTYIQGLSLLTGAEDKEPFATRIVCQYLGLDARRESWGDKIGVFDDSDFAALFDNADIVTRVLGDVDAMSVTNNG